MKKLIVLAVIAGVLGLSGLGCNKNDSSKATHSGTRVSETKATTKS